MHNREEMTQQHDPQGFRFKDLEAMWQGAVFFEDRRLWDFFRLPGE